MAQLFSGQYQSIKLVGLLLLRLFRWNSCHITICSTENNNIPSNEQAFFKITDKQNDLNFRSDIKKSIDVFSEQILTQRVGEFVCGFRFPEYSWVLVLVQVQSMANEVLKNHYNIL